jgi:L-threonylcarbamoyladenylate synthase
MMSSKERTQRLVADPAGIEEAARVLAAGGLVALPTETVYGLAARADDDDAVAAIYAAKGRPSFNPLIVHVASLEAARSLAMFDAEALKLARWAWPGPLTLVLPRLPDARLAEAVTAGLPTVAVRMPSHPVMRSVLEACGLPLAAPSANRSGAVSPTSAQHVLRSLKGRIDLVLDAGAFTLWAGVDHCCRSCGRFARRVAPGPAGPR